MKRSPRHEEEAILVHKGVQFELEKMKGKKWASWEEVKKEMKVSFSD